MTQNTKEDKLYELRDQIKYCPEPTYQFEVGDKVTIGCLINPVIIEVLSDGKVYSVSYQRNDKREGLLDKEDFWMWYDIRPQNETTESLIKKNEEASLYYSQRQLDGLFTIIYHFGCDMSPSYQREYVWTQEDKEALIESIFRGIDIGKFVFVHRGYDPDDYGYEILDGKQRLNALTEFFENRFPYRGKYYNDLCSKDKAYFKMYNISYAEMRDADYATKLYAFISLNTRGKMLDNSQIEYAKELYKKETGQNFE